ncbi:MAG: 6-phosphogluconolactonase [Actinomycetota bacterium]|nr:6-phosphogluconolactonase [Actinomycetota bacterium]
MRLEILGSDVAREEQAASHVADAATRSLGERAVCAVAFSGGSTPTAMLAALADQDLPWERIHVFQVDERIVPGGHRDRNLDVLQRYLLDPARVPSTNVHPMPVTDPDPAVAANRYAAELARVCGDPPVLDLVHLGLGADGHTASLVPDDPVVQISDRPVATTSVYRGHRRMTLTVPVLVRARQQLWLVVGADKADAVRRLVRRDPEIPASRVAHEDALLVLDDVAAEQVASNRDRPDEDRTGA